MAFSEAMDGPKLILLTDHLHQVSSKRMKNRFLFLLYSLVSTTAFGQIQCADPLSFTPVSQTNRINWESFPDFTLPFTIVYGGPRFSAVQGQPLKHGFSHIVFVRDNEFGTFVKPTQRALEWSGFAFGLNQPWETVESPWNNNLTAYRTKWDRWLSDASGGQTNAQGKFNLQSSLLMVDVERVQETDARILTLKTDPNTPAPYRQLSDAAFLDRYKKDMTALYGESLRYIRNRADLSQIPMSTYSDVPVRNTYLNVPGNTWADWTTNPNRVHFLTKDTTNTAKVGGPLYDQLDYLAPSGYYYYDYTSALAPDYLAYLLFQVEVNRAWSTKPVIPFVWMRYHDCCGNFPNFIQPFMAEATAIFPFFSGAKGLWLWEIPAFEQTRQDNYAAYEHFIHGLYRLSRFADMFQGTYELVIETPARDLMDARKPVWRGVVNGSKILIAAQNPYAADGQTTTMTVTYKNWSRAITLTGRQVYLCQHDLSVITGTDDPATGLASPDIILYPNPATDQVTITWPARLNNSADISVLTVAGQVVKQLTAVGKQTVAGNHQTTIAVTGLPSGLYLVRFQVGTAQAQKTFFIHNQ